MVAEFVETESGRKCDRLQLGEALAHARRLRATLCIAKLCRLARNVHFISGLMESGVPFVCADRPDADAFRLHVEAALGKRNVVGSARGRKTPFGLQKPVAYCSGASNPACRNLSDVARQRGTGATKAKAAAFYADVLPIIRGRRAEGSTLEGIATELNDSGKTTQRGLPFTPTAIRRLLARDK